MKVEVVTPEENMGDVMGDLNRRRGLIQGMDDNAGRQDHPRRGTAGRNVRLCHGPAFDETRVGQPTRWNSSKYAEHPQTCAEDGISSKGAEQTRLS